MNVPKEVTIAMGNAVIQMLIATTWRGRLHAIVTLDTTGMVAIKSALVSICIKVFFHFNYHYVYLFHQI